MRYATLTLALYLCAVAVPAADQHRVEAGIARLRSNPTVSLYRDDETGRVRFVTGRLSGPVASGEETDATYKFLEDNKTAFMMREPSEEIKVRRVDVDRLGMTHVRLDQQYRGVPVYGSNMIAHFTSDGVMKAINGTFVEDIDLDVTPSISADEASRVALADIDASFNSPESGESKLLVFPWEDENYLAWRVEVFSAAPIGRWEYFIDAQSGEIIYSASLIRYEAAIGTGLSTLGQTRNHIDTDFDGVEYRMIDATRQLGNDLHGHGGQMPPGNVIQTSVGNHPNPYPPDPPATDPDNVWDDPSQGPAVDGHVWSSLMYDWMLSVLGRNSFDDAGAGMWTTVDYEYEYPNNACWISTPNGGAVVVFTAGDGWNSLAACPDVIAHEWGHAITEYGSNLIYKRESGALDESFSDMIGTAFELAHDTLDIPDWLIAENAAPAEWGGIRDVSDPPVFYQPDYYGGDYWRNAEGCNANPANDNCYVHTNCGVGNKWFYLLSMGGTHHDVTVTGIGIENALRIAYRANMFYWTLTTNYAEAAYGTESAAEDLDPSGQWREQVQNAWEAVGVVTRPLPELTFSYPEGRPSLLMPGETTSLVVDITATFGGSVVPGSTTLNYRIDGGDVQITPLTQAAPGRYEAALPALDCGQYIEFIVEAQEVTQGLFQDQDPFTGNWWRAAPGTHPVVIREDDFEGPQWVKWALWGQWEAGRPIGSECGTGGNEPARAHSGTDVLAHYSEGADTNLYLQINQEYATSWPALDCSSYNTVHLTLWRWLNVEHPAYDRASVEVGTSWDQSWDYFYTVWENPTEITDSEWVKVDLDISHIAAGQDSVYVRFVWGTSDWLWWYCGWNVDDVTVTGYDCDTEADADGDQVPDYLDNCAFAHNPDQEDDDGDQSGNPCDACPGFDDAVDGDTDGAPDQCDNCEFMYNPTQSDSNGDGVGDACCCVGRVGDVNQSGEAEPTISDVSAIIDAKFITGNCQGIIGCPAKADINQSGGFDPSCDEITISDISILIDYLFITGSSLGLPDCL